MNTRVLLLIALIGAVIVAVLAGVILTHAPAGGNASVPFPPHASS